MSPGTSLRPPSSRARKATNSSPPTRTPSRRRPLRNRAGAGMKKERAHPRDIEGRQALFVVNLAARGMMGEVSEGMLFDIGFADGITPVLAVPERPVPNGA